MVELQCDVSVLNRDHCVRQNTAAAFPSTIALRWDRVQCGDGGNSLHQRFFVHAQPSGQFWITSRCQQFQTVLCHTQRYGIEILSLCQLQNETFGQSACADSGRLQHLHREQCLLQQ